MWFIGVEVEQETSAPPPKKNPGSAPDAYMKFSKKNFAPYAKNATVKNIITINKYNVGMKSLDRAIIVSDTLKTETSPSFIS